MKKKAKKATLTDELSPGDIRAGSLPAVRKEQRAWVGRGNRLLSRLRKYQEEHPQPAGDDELD